MPDGRLLVALREAKAVVAYETHRWSEVVRWPLEFRPARLAVGGDGRIAVGGQDGELVVLDRAGTVDVSRQIGRGPVHVAWIGGGRLAAAALWEPEVLILEGATLDTIATHPIGIEPGELLLARENLLVVADGFRGRFVLLRPGDSGTERTWRVDGVNVRGLAVSPDGEELLFVCMISPGPTQLTRTNIDWGQVLSSKVAAIGIDRLEHALGRDDGTLAKLRPRLLTLDGSRNGAADPAALQSSEDGVQLYVAAAGAHQVLHVDRSLGGPSAPGHRPLGDSLNIETLEVGRNPVALALEPGRQRLVTADSMADSLSVIDTRAFRVARVVGLGEERPERSAAELGEALFHDGRLALDRWLTCASCHPRGHTVGLNFDTLGDGAYANPKNTPSLLGGGATGPWGWTGRFATLESQVDQSLRTSLHGPGVTPEQTFDLVAYLRSLAPAPGSRVEREALVSEGRALFDQRGCAGCHRPESYTTTGLQDVGLGQKNERLNPPSLRGLARTAPYFHHGGAASIPEVLERHHPGFEDGPEPGELEALRAFLQSL
jgi:hypothetical protein